MLYLHGNQARNIASDLSYLINLYLKKIKTTMANNNPNEIKIELSPEVAKGIYSILAVISHGANHV